MSSLPAPLPRNRRAAAFERRTARALGAIDTGTGPLVVACSGGPDSVATLIAVSHALPERALVAAYFDHGLRDPEETEADSHFVEQLASLCGHRAVCGRTTERLAGDEASARTARYAWLEGVLSEAGSTTLVTGHTRDDQAETVLLSLVRGSGLRGASGMAPLSPWPLRSANSALRVVRPLLHESRAGVVGYLEALDVTARHDSTNEANTYARNRIRHDVLPELELVNAQARTHLAQFADRAAQDDAALDRWAREVFQASGALEGGRARVERGVLRGLPAAVGKRVIAVIAGELGLELDARQREAVLAITGRQGARIDLVGGRARTTEKNLELISPNG